MDGFPDAICIAFVRTGRTIAQGVREYSNYAEPILRINRRIGERAYIRNQGTYLFITKYLTDTLLFPREHSRSGQSRYRWVTKENGIRWGYLVEGWDRA
jgi:hypothetical protein